VTYTINPASHCNSNHLSYFKFVGRIIAKAVFDNKLLECYFTRSFYKHILGVPVKLVCFLHDCAVSYIVVVSGGIQPVQCESKKSSSPKTFCDIFTCDEPV